jgi:hypothetical protein
MMTIMERDGEFIFLWSFLLFELENGTCLFTKTNKILLFLVKTFMSIYPCARNLI